MIKLKLYDKETNVSLLVSRTTFLVHVIHIRKEGPTQEMKFN